MARLAWPIENVKRHYEVVVVGSGYGGSIAASRLSRAGKRVAILERGREFQPGEYPDTLREAWAQSQVDSPLGHVGPRTGLYDLRVNEEISVFQGCGLGGTSLVNAGVVLEPDSRVFDDPRWPGPLRVDLSGLEAGFRRAKEMLGATAYPDDFPDLPKLDALETSARRLIDGGGVGSFSRPPIAVTFRSGPNHVGVRQEACTMCGDCVSGCNYSSKNTLIMNYLPDARAHGAEIFTRAWVESVERNDGRWLVHFQLLDAGRETFDAPTLTVSADSVVLAAGSLGSTEILLRSRDRGLPLSGQVGMRFTGNGDVLGFAYNNDRTMNGIGAGAHPMGEMQPVGPTITGLNDLRGTEVLERGMGIEDGAIPGALSGFLPDVFAAAAAAVGHDTDSGFGDWIHEKAREWGGLFRGRYSDAMRDTQTFLVMAHDDGNGTMELEDDRLRIRWLRVGEQEVFGRIAGNLESATVPLGGTFVHNPVWSKVFGHDLITVHPLGGCVMADDASGGVVDHLGEVFSGDHGDGVHDGLFVMDGSIVPRPLGVNPLFTISALAERSCALIAAREGRDLRYDLPKVAAVAGSATPIGIEFTETMRGYVSRRTTDDFAGAAKDGFDVARRAMADPAASYADGSAFEFTLTIVSEDLETMLTDPEHPARMVGTVRARSMTDQPLTVTDGRFNLFTTDPARPGEKRMRYRMLVTDIAGTTYFFEGYKVIHDDPGVDIWGDTTTLYVTLYEGETAEGPVYAKGILRIRPRDFMRQLSTMRALNATGVKESLEAKARFGTYFAGALYDTYGALLV
jgi:cholesterol oxidase